MKRWAMRTWPKKLTSFCLKKRENGWASMGPTRAIPALLTTPTNFLSSLRSLSTFSANLGGDGKDSQEKRFSRVKEIERQSDHLIN